MLYISPEYKSVLVVKVHLHPPSLYISFIPLIFWLYIQALQREHAALRAKHEKAALAKKQALFESPEKALSSRTALFSGQ